MRRAFIAIAAILATTAAWPQSSPNLTYGQVPTAGQWNGYFAAKQDVIPYRPLNPAGGTMAGKLNTAPSTINAAGLSIPPGIPLGIPPAAPSSGDVWATSAGLFVRVGAVTGTAQIDAAAWPSNVSTETD
jgi:hypothetical protein